jgi:hypothetical protein
MYYALCCRNGSEVFMYGVAKVVGFDPRGLFRYWTPVRKSSRLDGIIKLKFIAVGKIKIPDEAFHGNKDDFMQDSEILRRSRFDRSEMMMYDEMEEAIRSNYKELKD